MSNLIHYYNKMVANGEIEKDEKQLEVLSHMQTLKDALHKPKRAWFPFQKRQEISSIYLYGSVGSGKTFLLNLFFQHVEERHKLRFHFHHFMQKIDAELRRYQGHKNPLQLIADKMAAKVKILFFDEFLVHDVAHAMILAELLNEFFKKGLIFVFTSNIKPDDLYLNGVQRDRFLPAIALIKQHCDVLQLTNARDYRQDREPLLEAYIYPLGQKQQDLLEKQFLVVAKSDIENDKTISVQKREIPFIKKASNAIWFDFNVICNLPRSQLDYLELSEHFDTFFISNIPKLKAKDTLAVILFIHLVDVFYDRRIRLIISADCPLDELYCEGEMLKQFTRTKSRLAEMQSADYLKHKV